MRLKLGLVIGIVLGIKLEHIVRSSMDPPLIFLLDLVLGTFMDHGASTRILIEF